MFGKELSVEAVECRIDRRHLEHDVCAICIIFQHLLYAAHLSFNAAQAV